MHDNSTKINRAHLLIMGYHCTTYDMNHTYSFLDIVFTSFLWQNQIKLIKLCILIKCGDFIAWACRYYLTTYLYLIWRMPDLWLSKYEHFKIFTLSPASSLICMTSLPKTIGHIFGPWAITIPHIVPFLTNWRICKNDILSKSTLKIADFSFLPQNVSVYCKNIIQRQVIV